MKFVQPFPAILIMPYLSYLLASILHRLISLLRNDNCCKITVIATAIAIFDIANVFQSSSKCLNVFNNSSNFNGNKTLWYNIQEYFHHVFMSLQFILGSSVISSNCFLFLHYFCTYRVDILMFWKIGASKFHSY